MPTRKARTPEHDFKLVIEGPLMDDEVIEALFEAGCGDATFGVIDDVADGDFTRSAPSLIDAIVSAIRDVESVRPLRVVRVENEDLLTMSEIARRLGRTRESVRLLVEGRRGKGGFPAPVSGTGRWRYWRWSDVLAWLDDVPEAELERARVVDAVNAALELRRRKALLPRPDRKAVQALAS
jgi:predicted DNA-binding transcriptional regulator AlpA